MSDYVNDNLLERAAEAIDNNPGLIADMISNALKGNDLIEIHRILKEIESEHPLMGDDMTDERAQAMYNEIKNDPTIKTDGRSFNVF